MLPWMPTTNGGLVVIPAHGAWRLPRKGWNSPTPSAGSSIRRFAIFLSPASKPSSGLTLIAWILPFWLSPGINVGLFSI